MKSFALLLLTMTFLLQGCGSSSSGNSNSAAPFGSPGAPVDSNGDTPAIKEAHDKCTNTPINAGNDMRYVMSENNNGNACTTGCQIFTSFSSYCNGLRNDQLNNNCAKDQRESGYQDSCTNN